MSEAMSQFDPSAFLQAQISEVNTKRPPIPTENPDAADGLYPAVIGQIKMESGKYERGDNIGKPWLSAIIPLQVEVPQKVQDALGLKLEKGYLVFTDRVFIDLTAHNTIDNSVGKNRGQKNYREALDLNKAGDIWSWQKAVGQPVKMKLNHDLYNGEIVEKVGGVFRR